MHTRQSVPMIDYVKDRLQLHGIKPTAMRMVVLDFLLSQKAAVSLKDIEVALENTDRITLYRTLRTFTEKGLIHSIEDGSGAAKYALCEEGCECRPEDLHVHFHCSICQKTYCLPRISIPAFTIPPGFSVESINLTAKGLCQTCA